MNSLKVVNIFTDGACSGNPGTGGCAAIIVCDKDTKEVVRGFRRTTNNRMELMALIFALEGLKEKCIVNISSDSQYLLNAFKKKWLEKWKSNGWKTASRTDVKNVDLWKQLDNLLSFHHPKFIWVKGHNDHIENTRCDQLAVKASKTPPYSIDNVYEKTYQ